MIHFGSAWYPEHWPISSWPGDLRLMAETGMNVVRIGEFAWSRLEPAEGQFQFDWFDQAISMAASYGLQVVLGTPTAAPPAWLTQRYPDTLAVQANGQTATHGMRCHYSPTSPRYLEFCRRIAEEMAKCFGSRSQVIGWQIDNEYRSVSYDPETRRQFQAWLKKRFVTLAALADHWATAYWSEDYSDWTQIPLPVGDHNPGLRLAFQEFITDVYVNFQRVQLEAIRAHSLPSQWITHNFMKWFDTFDHYTVAKDLDLVSWDNYVPTGHLDYVENGAMHDLMYGLKHKNFWVMETQPGQVNWGKVNTTLNKGEVRTMAWHAIGHGADAILYWQWRSALGGQEQMHGTLVAPDGTSRPVYNEVVQLGKDIAAAQEVLADSVVSTTIAVLHTYTDRWTINFQRHHEGFDPVAHMLSFYRPLRVSGQSIAIVSPQSSLSGYQLVVAPNLNSIEPATARHLLDYVQNGGHLVLGPRSGVKDEFNALLPVRQPGPFAAMLGADIADYYALNAPIAVTGQFGTGTASIWAEQIRVHAADVEVLLRYGASNGWLDGQPAMVTRAVGNGRLTYIAAWFDSSLMDQITVWLLNISQIPAAWAMPPLGVELCTRINANRPPCYVLINHTTAIQQVQLPRPLHEVLTDRSYETTLALSPLGIAVLY